MWTAIIEVQGIRANSYNDAFIQARKLANMIIGQEAVNIGRVVLRDLDGDPDPPYQAPKISEIRPKGGK